jgi:hypothetical protein
MKRRFIICTVTKHQEDQVKEDAKGGHVGGMGETRNVYKVLVGKPEEERTLWNVVVGWFSPASYSIGPDLDSWPGDRLS